jgi:hypothetical protein
MKKGIPGGYPLFQAQWVRGDQQNHQSYNNLVKDIIYIAEREIKGSG